MHSTGLMYRLTDVKSGAKLMINTRRLEAWKLLEIDQYLANLLSSEWHRVLHDINAWKRWAAGEFLRLIFSALQPEFFFLTTSRANLQTFGCCESTGSVTFTLWATLSWSPVVRSVHLTFCRCFFMPTTTSLDPDNDDVTATSPLVQWLMISESDKSDCWTGGTMTLWTNWDFNDLGLFCRLWSLDSSLRLSLFELDSFGLSDFEVDLFGWRNIGGQLRLLSCSLMAAACQQSMLPSTRPKRLSTSVQIDLSKFRVDRSKPIGSLSASVRLPAVQSAIDKLILSYWEIGTVGDWLIDENNYQCN